MGVSENRGTSKWMVYNGKPYFLMDDLGGKPTIFGNTHIYTVRMYQLPPKPITDPQSGKTFSPWY